MAAHLCYDDHIVKQRPGTVVAVPVVDRRHGGAAVQSRPHWACDANRAPPPRMLPLEATDAAAQCLSKVARSPSYAVSPPIANTESADLSRAATVFLVHGVPVPVPVPVPVQKLGLRSLGNHKTAFRNKVSPTKIQNQRFAKAGAQPARTKKINF